MTREGQTTLAHLGHHVRMRVDVVHESLVVDELVLYFLLCVVAEVVS